MSVQPRRSRSVSRFGAHFGAHFGRHLALLVAAGTLALVGCDDEGAELGTDGAAGAGGAGAEGGAGGAGAGGGAGGEGGAGAAGGEGGAGAGGGAGGEGGAGAAGGGGPGEVKSNLERDLAPVVDVADRDAMVGGLNAFGFDLYAQVEGEFDNFFFSPFSIHQALAMTWAGARGDTEAQMSEVLRLLPADQGRLHPAANALDLALAGRADEALTDCQPDADCAGGGDPFQLSVANAIWGQAGYGFLDAFLDTLAVNYGAGLRLLDFAADPEAARQIINGWVEDQTADRIRDLLPQGSIDGGTRLVLTNAIYFKASWAWPFDEGNTAPRDFHVGGREPTAPVPTMEVSGEFGVARDDTRTVSVRLPYVGNQLSMIIVMPSLGAMSDFPVGFQAEDLLALRGRLAPEQIRLRLPKFTFETDLPLTQPLKALGLTAPFEAADFSGMDGTRNLQVTDVLHKAFVAVDEKGTEAAAATAVVVGETSVPVFEPLDIDRPFLFFIVDEPTNTVLFFGRVNDPR